MPVTAVALILKPVAESLLKQLPPLTATWIASNPEMQSTIAAAHSMGLEVTELFPNGDTPAQWLSNHLDSLDQHYNQFSQQPPYSQLLVFGVSHSPSLLQFLSEFGFKTSHPTPFGFIVSKLPHQAMPGESNREA